MTDQPAIDHEVQYNNRARVADHLEIFAQWQQDAASFRDSQTAGQLDLTYGPAARNRYDFFPAAPGAPAQSRTALFIHGGYWQSLDKSSFSHAARGLTLHGFDVAIANYTLCPATSVSGIIAEMRRLAGHLVRTWGKPLLVSGHSAGGHLTAALMATDWSQHDLPPDTADRGMPISGVFDLVPLVGTSINGALRFSDATAAEASPLLWPMPRQGKFVAAVGGLESEEFLRQSQVLAETWRGDTLSGSVDIVDGANHFTVVAPLADPDSDLVTQLTMLARS